MKDDSNNKQLEFTEEKIEVFYKMKYAGQLPLIRTYPILQQYHTFIKMVSFISQLIIIQENTRTLKRTEELLL
ncbi:MAG TPA: hypothetical protein VKA95_01160 [Nitrososphaeraceae archaeon]|nr:hypothetical protein [Nitrososphaeraceae archaeon]